jgi:hypothetical protein
MHQDEQEAVYRHDKYLLWTRLRTAGKKLNQNFIQHPEKVMELENATKIMFLGMQEGWFTGKKLGDYFNSQKEDWVHARRIINGLDRADWIASYAKKYYGAISYTLYKRTTGKCRSFVYIFRGL